MVKRIETVGTSVEEKLTPAPRLFTPTGKWVILQVHPAKKQTISGLSLPDDTAEVWETPRAWVIAVGPDCKQVKEGMTVFSFNSVVAQKVHIGGHRLVAIEEPFILGIDDGAPDFRKSKTEDDGRTAFNEAAP